MARRITAQEFMSTPPRRQRGRPSLLAPYASDLVTMRSKRYSLSEIREFLKLNDVEVGVSTICMFFKRREAVEAEARNQPGQDQLNPSTDTAGAVNDR